MYYFFRDYAYHQKEYQYQIMQHHIVMLIKDTTKMHLLIFYFQQTFKNRILNSH